MGESFVQLPADSTGKKLRTHQETIGANTVETQIIKLGAFPTYYALADAVAFAQNKHHITIFNAAGSGKIVKIRKVFTINNALAAVTGVAIRFDYKRCTASSAGTTITSQQADSGDAALPAQITVRTNGSITEGALLWPQTVTNDEVGATQAFPSTSLMAGINWLPEGNEVKELTLREGEGLTIKQITSSTVGSFSWLVVFTVE